MNTVWVLISIVYSGHFVNTIVPTLEFKTQSQCEAAIDAFAKEAENREGRAKMRCVRIEK